MPADERLFQQVVDLVREIYGSGDVPLHRPVFAGDDITDESGFAIVNRRGGLSVLVGEREPSAAHFALRSPEAVRRWLAEGVPA